MFNDALWRDTRCFSPASRSGPELALVYKHLDLGRVPASRTKKMVGATVDSEETIIIIIIIIINNNN